MDVLLNCLVSHQSKESLMFRFLRVNMANIRRKLEQNPAQPQYVFTEIGVGYRMRENENVGTV